MRNYSFIVLFLLGCFSASSQMEKNGQILYGNEWIDYSKTYIKINVDEDGLYFISYNNLLQNGFSASQLVGSDLQLFAEGEEMPLYVTNNGNWSTSDYLIFYGERNQGTLDQFLFEDPENEQINPKVSMFSTEKSYYLTLSPSTTNLRYEPQSNDVAGTSLVKEEFFMEQLQSVFSEDVWDPGAPTDRDLQFSHFIAMDGFASRMTSDHQLEVEIEDYYQNGPEPEMELRIGSNNSSHFLGLEFNNNQILNDVFEGSKVKQYDFEFASANLREGTNYVRLRGLSTADNVSISCLNVIYPKTFDAKNSGLYEFYSGQDNFDEYVEVPNFSATNRNFVFDLDNQFVITPQIDGNTAKVIIPGGAVEGAKIILSNDAEFLTPLSMESAKFTNYDDLNPEYLIITSRLLNKEENGRNVIEEYADFRSSELGGNYRTAIVDVEDLYNQFGYGVDKHSIAIRNFGAYVRDKWPDFEMVFLMGKALSFANNFKNTIAKSIVPTYGRPGSDNLLFSDNGKAYPYIGVGRLAAQSQQDLIAYIEKAEINAALSDVANLTIDQRLWLKNILHLSGGDPKIQQEIFDTLNVMKNIIENNKYAGSVMTFQKNTSDPVTTALTDQILKKINDGISILTFFGHSSAGTFDFSIEDPSKYMNFGKHPVVLSMGCHSGDIHESIYSLSESFLLTPELGAIGFIASAGNAYPEPLSDLGIGFYSEIGSDHYGLPISLAIREVLKDQYSKLELDYQSNTGSLSFNNKYASMVSLIEQNTFHGDPAITFFTADAPDFVVDFSSIQTMDVVGTSDEEIELCFDLLNLGSGLDADSLNNYILHSYGSGQTDTIFFKSVASKNREKTTVKIKNPGKAALGKNSINIVLDYDNAIAEEPNPIAEENNDLNKAWSITEGFCFFIFDNSAQPIFPRDFGILGQQDLTLKASAPNALAKQAYYEVQIDTTEEFDSPLLISEEVLSYPSLIEWQPAINYEQETVYYWRIKPKGEDQAIWSTSSFVYLADVPGGWNQSHFYQWTKDNTTNAFIDSTSRNLTYVENVNDIRLSTGVYPNSRITITHQDNINKFIQFADEIVSGVYLTSFDGDTGIPMYNDPTFGGEFGSFFGGSRNWVGDEYFCFPFKSETKEERENIINFIENEVPEGNYIALFTIQRSDIGNLGYYPERWEGDSAGGGQDLMSVLEKYGAKDVRALATNELPYFFIFKKNDDSFTPIERTALNLSDEIEIDLKINAKWFEGEIRSTTIGPASAWDKLIWNIDEIDLQEDSYRLDVIGCDKDGNETLIYENVDEFDFDLSEIPANVFPELKLNLYTSDETSRTSAQMEHWRVLYTELPEAVLNTGEKFVFNSDTISGGENFVFSTVATNITNADMDSLLVEYAITDGSNTVHTMSKRLAPLKAFETIDLDFETPTTAYIGVNEFRVEINPNAEQLEQFYFNNIGLRTFSVLGDAGNPLLDVTFDGVRILDRDIISPTPSIVVTLKDDNSSNPITDISSFELGLKVLPDGQEETIPLDSENIIFYPADSTNNYCASIEYTPEFESGEYIFFAQGRDASGNLSGDQSFAVEFEVVLESQISNVLNYPNPFSTSTEFIFTLTGREVPEEMSIQIYSMSGKVVKEITKEELGLVKIGLNRTKYKWNGTDDFGNKLANGVYFYRILTSEVDGEELGQYYDSQGKQASTDKYFKKGFGKLVIMR